jgi:signal transduction histidine kinase
VTLRAGAADEHVVIEVEDQCGGMPDSMSDPFRPFGERRAKNRSGLGLGLSIARKAVRAQGGDVEFRNRPGTGCTFAIRVPLAGERDMPVTPVNLPA